MAKTAAKASEIARNENCKEYGWKSLACVKASDGMKVHADNVVRDCDNKEKVHT